MARPHRLRQPRPVAERFWERVDKSGDCWLWTGYVSATGYGRLARESGKLVLAHRLSWELAHGAIPDGLRILHRCDVRNCVRPDHLFLGSQADNILDAVRKGRHRAPTPRKIDEAQAAQIKLELATGATHQSIADRHGISRPLVSLIASGKRWAHA